MHDVFFMMNCMIACIKSGTDVTLVAVSRAVGIAMEAAKQLQESGINAEVINLRTLRPLDRDTVFRSVMKTHYLVTVEGGWPQFGVGAEISASVMESPAFDYLDGPILRVSSADVPTPYCHSLEQLSLPQPHNVVNTVLKLLPQVSTA